jgi:hypothetical protein
MKELEVKAMLADPNIPDEYKLGGRLDSRFLDGVEYAERVFNKGYKFVAKGGYVGEVHLYERDGYGKLYPVGSIDLESSFPYISPDTEKTIRIIVEEKEQ